MHSDFRDGGSRHHHHHHCHHHRHGHRPRAHVTPYGEGGFVVGDRCPSGGGIPGDYMEHIDGVPDEVLAERVFGAEPTPPVFPAGSAHVPADDGDGVACQEGSCDCGDRCGCHDGSLSDALLRVRLACKALSDMTDLVARESGTSLSVAFLPPYHAAGAGRADGSPAEWLLLVDGEVTFYESYDRLCELWEEGPAAMHGFLSDVEQASAAVRDIVGTIGDILSQPDDGDGEDDVPFAGVFVVDDGDEDGDESAPGHEGHGHHRHRGHHEGHRSHGDRRHGHHGHRHHGHHGHRDGHGHRHHGWHRH